MLNKKFDKVTKGLTKLVVRGKEYIEEACIAHGHSSIIYRVIDPSTNEKFALKLKHTWSDDMFDKILNEVVILRELKNHENIVRLVDYEILDNSAKIVTELGTEGTLLDYVNSLTSPLPECEILSYIKQIANALLPIHEKLLPVAHRDVKMDKILKFGKTLKLCDLGCCSTLTLEPRLVDAKTKMETILLIEKNTALEYRPPEMRIVKSNFNINEKVDIWMIGCIFYKLIYKVNPFGDNDMTDINKIQYNCPHSYYSEKLIDFMRIMLTPDPNNRPDVKTIIKIVDNWDKINKIELPKEVQNIKSKQGYEVKTPVRTNKYDNQSLNTKVDSKETKQSNMEENISSISNFISEDENLKINKTEYEGFSNLNLENKKIFIHNKLEEKEPSQNKLKENEQTLEQQLKSIKVYSEIFGKKSDFVLSSDESSLRKYDEWVKNKDIYKKNFIGSGGSGLSLSEDVLSKKGTQEMWSEQRDFYKKNFFDSDKNAISPVRNEGSAGVSLKENTSEFFKYTNSDIDKAEISDLSLKASNLITITNNPNSNSNTICINSNPNKNLMINIDFNENKLNMNIKVGENGILNSSKKDESERFSRRIERAKPNSRYSHLLLEESEKKDSKAVKKTSGNTPRNKIKRPVEEIDSD